MKPMKTSLVVLMIGLIGFVAACSDSDSRFRNPGREQTLKEFAVDDITHRTSDTAEPVQINDRDLDMSNEDPAHYDDLLQSS